VPLVNGVPDTGCADLSVEYECTVYDDEGDNFRRTGTRFRVTNFGDVATAYDLAVANEPGDWRGGLAIDATTNQGRVADASVPTEALVFWECTEDVPTGAQTWGEYRDANGFADLEDWYETVGSTASAPAGAPQDVDDDLLVVGATTIPDGEPDENIDPTLYPDMSVDAEAEGWVTCDKHDGS
jgi:hypothetical protein